MTTLEQRTCIDCGAIFHVEQPPAILYGRGKNYPFICHINQCEGCRPPVILDYTHIKATAVTYIKAGDAVTLDQIKQKTLTDMRAETDGIYRDLARRYKK